VSGRHPGVTGLHRAEIAGVAIAALPEGATLLRVAHAEYIANALATDAVRQQLAAGIYEPGSFAEEFLGVACAWPALGVVEIDDELLIAQMTGVPNSLAVDYATWIFLHEAQHLREGVGDRGSTDWLHREAACEAAIAASHPELFHRAQTAAQLSAPIARVHHRITTLRARPIEAG